MGELRVQNVPASTEFRRALFWVALVTVWGFYIQEIPATVLKFISMCEIFKGGYKSGLNVYPVFSFLNKYNPVHMCNCTVIFHYISRFLRVHSCALFITWSLSTLIESDIFMFGTVFVRRWNEISVNVIAMSYSFEIQKDKDWTTDGLKIRYQTVS